ncbi:hypothetical protein GmHk_04G010035 [Glycine max]|nr:hypothetical protein GmHk_04G010035 [Glycine max]
MDYHERKPRVCRWKSGKALLVVTYRKRLDRLTSDVVCWIPYDYMNKFYRISHRFTSLLQLVDPPRHPPMVHDDTFIVPDPPVLPIQSATMPQPLVLVAANADMPRHAVATCQRIVESLERMIHKRMVTAETDAYTLTKHCLRLARSVTNQRNVYVQYR